MTVFKMHVAVKHFKNLLLLVLTHGELSLVPDGFFMFLSVKHHSSFLETTFYL